MRLGTQEIFGVLEVKGEATDASSSEREMPPWALFRAWKRKKNVDMRKLQRIIYFHSHFCHWLFILVSFCLVYVLQPANTGIFRPLRNLFYLLWTSSWKSSKYIVFNPEIFKVHFNSLLITWKHSYCHFMNYFQGVTHTPQSFAPSPHIPT